MRTSDSFEAINGTTLHLRRWWPDGHPRATVQLVHGMVEHVGRYDQLGAALAERGFAVIADDHRGHGQSMPAGRGRFADRDGWATVVEDLHQVHLRTRAEHPGLPHFVVGHSMGSLLTRDLVATHHDDLDDDLAGAVIVGTATWPGLRGALGLGLARALNLVVPARPATLLNSMTFAGHNDRFEHRTDSDWISDDPDWVDAYLADPLCGFVPTNSFFVDLLQGTRRVSDPTVVAGTPKRLPLLLIGGELDPVGGPEAIEQVANLYLRHGVSRIERHIVPGGRHEVLHERPGRHQVLDVLVDWLERHC